jgi:hypothetical protein
MTWTDITGLAVAFLTISAIVLAGLMWFIRAVVRQELEKATKAIQPGYKNGGDSLADISHKLDLILRGEYFE